MKWLILISFFYSTIYAIGHWVDYTQQGERSFSHIKDKVFFLKEIALQSDIFFSNQDLFLLTGLQKNKNISCRDIENACFYLRQSNRFKKVYFKIIPYQEGIILSFKLQAQWLVSHIAIDNIWLGKDLLKQRYLIRPGEPFEPSKHQQSLKRYHIYFKKRGYLSVSLRDELKWSKKDKMVAVAIHIHKGGRFSIKDISSVLDGIDDEKFKNFINSFLKRRLKFRIYKSKLINEVIRDLKFDLLKKGFPLTTIQMKESRVSRLGVQLNFVIKIPPESHFIIQGNQKFSYEQLIIHIARDQALLWHVSAPILVNVIKQWYRQHGFLRSEVHVDHTEKGWKISIDEGPRIKINDIAFFGIQSLAADDLKPLFRSLFLKDYLDDTDLIAACDTLLNFYVRNGFWDVEIEDRDFKEDGDAYILNLSINEGVQRVLKGVSVASDLACNDQKELSQLLSMRVPCSFDLHLFDRQREQIVSFLKKRGLEAIIQPLFDENKKENFLVWDIKKKDSQTIFGHTIITGVPSIDQQKILSELAYSVDTDWNRKKLDKTFRNLRDLNIFESIRLYPLAIKDPLDRRPVVLDLVADDPLALQARVGFIGGNRSRANTYKVGGSVLYKNLSNRADTFSFNADVTRFWRDISVCYSVPHINGAPLSGEVLLLSRQYDQLCYTGCQSQLYTVSEIGGVVGLHFKKGPLLADVKGGVKTIKIFNLFTQAARAICFEPCLIGYREPYFLFEPQIALEKVDNTMNPSCGFISRVGAHLMVPLDHRIARLARVLVEQSFFVPIHDRIIGAFRMRAGHIFAQSFYQLLPSERFYLGGPCTVRSYQQDFVAPVANYLIDDCLHWVPQGSQTMFNSNVELRGSLNKNLGIVLFYDGGFLRNELTREFCFGQAFGLGFRYLTPLGPLRFDIGWKGKYYPADRSSLAWFLSVGHAF